MKVLVFNCMLKDGSGFFSQRATFLKDSQSVGLTFKLKKP